MSSCSTPRSLCLEVGGSVVSSSVVLWTIGSASLKIGFWRTAEEHAFALSDWPAACFAGEREDGTALSLRDILVVLFWLWWARDLEELIWRALEDLGGFWRPWPWGECLGPLFGADATEREI